MRRNRIFSAGALTAAFVMMLLLVGSQTHAQDGTLHETFDDPLPPGWELSPEATVADGVLRIPGGSFAFYHSPAADFTLSLRARFLSGMGEILLQYRTADFGAYQVVIGPSYAMLIQPNSTPLGATDLTPLEDWFEIGVTAQGDQHTISINGQPVLTAIDAGHLSGNGIGLQILSDGVVEFDDFRWSMAGESLPPPDQGAGFPDGNVEAVLQPMKRPHG